MGTLSRRTAGFCALLLAGLAGCPDEATDPAEEPPGPERASREDEAPPDEAPPASPWPADVRSLHESLEHFESVDACVAGLRPGLAVEVAELFADLQYVDALHEVCRGLDAVKRGDPETCDGLTSSVVARQCRTRLATYHGTPEACPSDRTTAGARDPLCLAWATRNAGLCDAAPAHLQGRCLAVATGEPGRCRRDRERATCEALVARLGDRVNADPPADREPAAFTLDGELRGDALALATGAAEELAHGIVVRVDGCGHVVRLESGRPHRATDSSVALTLEIGWTGEDPPTLGTGSEVALGVVGTTYALRGTVDLEGVPETLGDPLEGTFRGTFTRDATDHEVTGTFRTFIRDREPLPARCAP
ncbi:MAG: hypothetical protein CMN30_31635 [Sandaracinus sp.]|nr:hypothetical protein [Sandaracinus sp.]